MKTYKQKISLLALSLVLAMGVSVVGAQTDDDLQDANLNPDAGTVAGSFNGPCGAPGTCNAPVLLSVAANDQVKMGTLRALAMRVKRALFVGYDHTSPLGTLGSVSDFKLGVNGNVGAKKYCDENGINCRTVVELTNGGLANLTYTQYIGGNATGAVIPSGPHKFCALSFVDAAGSDQAACQVFKDVYPTGDPNAGQIRWRLKMSEKTGTAPSCGAMCFK